jgi:hypothetical protein
MSLGVPIRVPVELGKGGRWFRMSVEIAPSMIWFAQAAPDELEGPLTIAFHLPGDPRPVRGHGRLVEVRTIGDDGEERASRSAVTFTDLDPDARSRIEAYVQERLEEPA